MSSRLLKAFANNNRVNIYLLNVIDEVHLHRGQGQISLKANGHRPDKKNTFWNKGMESEIIFLT